MKKKTKKIGKNLNNFQTNTILNVNKNFKIYIYIYTKKVNGIRIWNKYNWYENGEKSTKFFLNHENIVQPKAVFVQLLCTKGN